MDYFLNGLYLKLLGEKKSLIIFIFHALYRVENERRLNIVEPLQGISIKSFRQFINYYIEHGYTFISPDDIVSGLDSKKNYALITFDDGYYNNSYALPVLNEFKIPAVFFISTEFVKHNKSFWWDVLHREKMKRGVSIQTALEEINIIMSSWPNERIDRYITNEFGKNAFKPIGDIDRPFSPGELKDFSKNRFVFIGNHTSVHSYLSQCQPEEIRSTIIAAQQDIHDMTGEFPRYISYPHGAYSNEVLKITRQLGLQLGFAVDNRKNYLPIDPMSDEFLRLGRFALRENNQLLKQCQSCRTDIQLTKVIKNLMGRE